MHYIWYEMDETSLLILIIIIIGTVIFLRKILPSQIRKRDREKEHAKKFDDYKKAQNQVVPDVDMNNIGDNFAETLRKVSKSSSEDILFGNFLREQGAILADRIPDACKQAAVLGEHEAVILEGYSEHEYMFDFDAAIMKYEIQPILSAKCKELGLSLKDFRIKYDRDSLRQCKVIITVAW